MMTGVPVRSCRSGRLAAMAFMIHRVMFMFRTASIFHKISIALVLKEVVDVMYGYYGSGTGNMMWGGGMWLMMIGGIFFLLLIAVGIGVVIWAAMRGGTTGGTGTPRETPLEILKKRYANGEIDKKQYDEMMKDLMK